MKCGEHIINKTHMIIYKSREEKHKAQGYITTEVNLQDGRSSLLPRQKCKRRLTSSSSKVNDENVSDLKTQSVQRSKLSASFIKKKRFKDPVRTEQ